MFPKRIILSRKGFDESAGGCASPILPDGTMLSIPIPEDLTHRAGTAYEDLCVQGNCPLPASLITSPRRNFPLKGPVHLDPDIRPSLRSKKAQESCVSSLLLYGQDGGFQTHLATEGVTAGDLFLFFGWFRDAEWNGRDVQFLRGAKNRHVIWGWLQVEKPQIIAQNGEIPDSLRSAKHHPHLDDRNRQNNCLYRATPTLSFSPQHAGAGIFDRYASELCLTALGETRRSYWALPLFFQRAEMSFHKPWNGWATDGEKFCGKSVGRGQEFVFNTEHVHVDARAWLRKLFQYAGKQN